MHKYIIEYIKLIQSISLTLRTFSHFLKTESKKFIPNLQLQNYRRRNNNCFNLNKKSMK